MRKKILTIMLALTTIGASAQDFYDGNGGYYGPEELQEYSGAYYTGDYTSPFKTVLGKTDEEIQAKLDELWDHYFKGNGNSKVYYDRGQEAYILDTGNNDVRSEGMSYGMMIAVQTNHKAEFDKLWAFAKNHMWHKSGQWDGYFSWQCGTDGSVRDQNNAPDGEMYFMMSLMFAANRWNDYSYMTDAQYILEKCWKNGSGSLFNESQRVICFQPYTCSDFSDPSYDLPAFVDLFSRWSITNKDKWTDAAQKTRDHLYKSSNTTSGLFSDYNNFDGTPKSLSYNTNSTKYMYDAMRCAMNFGMDYYLFGADAERQETMAKRLIDFFEADDYTHARFDWDGKNPSESYTIGEAGANAVACYCLLNYPEYKDAVKRNLEKAWNAIPMTGQYRYYDGLVHYLSMLHLCGAFKIWKPAPGVFNFADKIPYNLQKDEKYNTVNYAKTLEGNRIGKYQAWFMPFDYTISTADEEDFVFYEVNMITNSPDPSVEPTNDVWVRLKKIGAGDVLKANIPYAYKPKTYVSKYIFTTTNATLKAKETNAVVTQETADNIYSIFGTYDNINATTWNPFYYVNINGKLSLGTSVTVGPYRWIIRKENKAGGKAVYADALNFFVDSEDNSTTGITSYAKKDSENAWYTLNGIKLNGKPSEKGVYVVNGKKIVIQ